MQVRRLAALALAFTAIACTSLDHSKDGDKPATDAAISGEQDASTPAAPHPGSDASTRPPAGKDAGKPVPSADAGEDAGSEPAADGSAPCEELTFYADLDGDDYGDPATAISACEAPAGYVSDRSDCDDDCKSCHPGADETCDQHDNNCDDTVDEGCACEPGTSRPCGDDEGVCEAGTQSCDDGTWSNDCTGSRGPDPSELCNGLDDDCNGTADDGIAGLGDACTAGKGECEHSGKMVCASDPAAAPVCDATPGNPVTEVCANSLDDDCDGKTDEAPSASTCCVDAHCGNADKKCSNGSCVDKIGCELRSKPSDVLAADYQCIDFDHGASFSPWTTSTATGGTIAASTTEASSGTHSVYATLSGSTGSEGKLKWTATGAKTIKSMSLSADVHFPDIIGFHDFWTGHDEVLCIRYGSSSYCVTWSRSEDYNDWVLALEETQTTGVIETHTCFLSTPAENVWSRIELRVSSTGAPSVLLNGTALSSPDCTFTLLNTTSATFEVGMKQTDADEGWQLYYDDAEALVRR